VISTAGNAACEPVTVNAGSRASASPQLRRWKDHPESGDRSSTAVRHHHYHSLQQQQQQEPDQVARVRKYHGVFENIENIMILPTYRIF